MHDICVSAFVDPGVVDTKVHDNEFSNTATVCNYKQTTYGVKISGRTNTDLKGNKSRGIKNLGAVPGPPGIGISVVDDASGHFTKV